MKNFKIKNRPTIYPFIGTYVNFEGKTCYKTEFGGFLEEFCEMTDEENQWETFYMRCLTYPQADIIVKYGNSIGSECNVTTGGIRISGFIDMWDEIIEFADSISNNYEICYKHPELVTQELFNNYKRDNNL